MRGTGTVVPFVIHQGQEAGAAVSATHQVGSTTLPRATGADASASPPDGEALPLSREDVMTAFELLLGREAESEEAILYHRALASRVALGAFIRDSLEFRSRHAPAQRKDVAAFRGEEEDTAWVAPLGGDCTSLSTWRFARDGDGVPLLGDGWSVPEPEFCCTLGPHSELELPMPPGHFAGGLALTLWVMPSHGAQRLSIEVEGTRIASGLVRRRTEFACRVPAHLLADRKQLHLVLHHPDASRPCDYEASRDERMLGIAVGFARFSTLPPDAQAPDDATLMHAFASLGDNCEFGFVQERCGVFAGGLLRFNILPPDRLLHGLATRFEGFPDRSRMRLEWHRTHGTGGEYIVYEDGYGFSGHTGVSEPLDSAGEEELLEREYARVGFLTRMLLDDLQDGETVFVFKRNVVPPEAEVMALWLAIRRLGRCALLWVVPAHPGMPAGTVAVLAEGLFKASIDRLAPYTDAEDLSLPCWLTICRRTLRLSRLGGTPGDIPGGTWDE